MTKLTKTQYKVFIITSYLPGSDSTSKIFISLSGINGDSSESLLSNHGFTKGLKEVQIFLENVGNITAIKLRNEGSNDYRCDTIRVSQNETYWDFECNESIVFPDNPTATFKVSNLMPYDISVKTSQKELSGTTSAVYISIWGTAGKTPFKLLSAKGLERGSLEKFQVMSTDVSSVYGITLKIGGFDNWFPEEIIVTRNESINLIRWRKSKQVFSLQKLKPH